MHRICIAVVDASCARVFEHRRTSSPSGLDEELVELTDLVNPARRLKPSQLLESGPGFDDHRAHHIDQLDAEFAGEVTAAIAAQLKERPASRLILCASPRMLGALRRTLDVGALTVDEVPRDLVKLAPVKLREHLVSYGLLPDRVVH